VTALVGREAEQASRPQTGVDGGDMELYITLRDRFARIQRYAIEHLLGVR